MGDHDLMKHTGGASTGSPPLGKGPPFAGAFLRAVSRLGNGALPGLEFKGLRGPKGERNALGKQRRSDR